MPALERARPEMGIAELAARAQAQLALEIHRHARFTFNVSDGADGGVTELTPENLAHFNRGFRDYRRLYGRRIRRDPEARRLDREFRLWYLKKSRASPAVPFARSCNSRAGCGARGALVSPPRDPELTERDSHKYT